MLVVLYKYTTGCVVKKNCIAFVLILRVERCRKKIVLGMMC